MEPPAAAQQPAAVEQAAVVADAGDSSTAAAGAAALPKPKKQRGNLRKRPGTDTAAADGAPGAGASAAAGDGDGDDDPTSVVRRAKAARGDPLAFSTRRAADSSGDAAVTFTSTASALASKDTTATRTLETETEFDRDARCAPCTTRCRCCCCCCPVVVWSLSSACAAVQTQSPVLFKLLTCCPCLTLLPPLYFTRPATHRAQRERMLAASAAGARSDGAYRGANAYVDYTSGMRREGHTVGNEKGGGAHGPLRGNVFVRTTARCAHVCACLRTRAHVCAYACAY